MRNRFALGALLAVALALGLASPSRAAALDTSLDSFALAVAAVAPDLQLAALVQAVLDPAAVTVEAEHALLSAYLALPGSTAAIAEAQAYRLDAADYSCDTGADAHVKVAPRARDVWLPAG